jgi:hypothetical protein
MNRNGLTLVEVMIVSLLLVLVGGASVIMMSSSHTAWTTTDLRLELMTNSQRALDRLSEDLRQASANPIAAFSLTAPGANCAANTLQFISLKPGETNNMISYTLGGNQLTRSSTPTEGPPFYTLNGDATTHVVGAGLASFTPACSATAVGVVTLTLLAQPTTPDSRVPPQTIVSQVWVQNP